MTAPVLQFKRGLLANLPGLRAGEPGFTTDSYDLYVGIDSTTNNNKFFGSHRYWNKETSTTGSGLRFVERTDGGSNYIELKAPNTALGSNVTFTLPAADGAANQVIYTDGSGNLGFTTVSSNLSIAGDTGTDTVTAGVDTLTFAGTANEIETTVTNNQVQIGLPNNVVVGGALTVSGNTTLGDSGSDVITVTGIATFPTSNVYVNQQLFVGGLQVTGGGSAIGEDIVTRNFKATGVSTFVGAVTFESAAYFGDGDKLYFGDSNDLEIFHNGENSFIKDTGTGTLNIVASGFSVLNAGSNETLANFTPDGSVELYYDNSKKFETTGVGATITGDLGVSGNLAVAGTSEFIGVATFRGGTINLGDSTGDDINVGGEFISGLFPNTTATYDLGDGSRQWRYGNFSGIVTATTFSGNATSADQVKTVTASNNNATYHITFVDANNGSATNESVYTDDGIYYNPGTNTFTTQHALFTGDVTVQGTLTGTATTATRATLVDTTGTSTNADYYVTFVDTLAGQNGETIRVGAGLSVNPSTGEVKTGGVLSVGNAGALTSYIKAGGGSNAMYLYSNGDVSFQQKVIVGGLRSSSNSNNTLILNDLDATFARDLIVTGITTTGTLKLSGTSGIGITGISSSTTLAENSNSYLPTQAAVKAYVDAVDVTTGIAGDTGTGTVSTSQTLTIAGTAGEIETSASSQTITVGLPDTVIVGTALSAPTLKTATLQHRNGTQAATIDTSGNITASQNLTITGNLYVNGSTTQVNTTSVSVEDRTIELGQVDGSAPSSTTTWDLGVLFNYYDGSAKKSALVWEQSDARFKLGSVVSADADGSGSSNPQITFSTYAPLEIGGLWVNDCAGASQVINCAGGVRTLENITIDAGQF